jgi:hypothetical protein
MEPGLMFRDYGGSMRVYRMQVKSCTKQHPTKERCRFVLGYPKHGSKKHLVENKVLANTEDDMVDLIATCFSVRVETETRPSLVRLNLLVDGKKVT